MSLWWNIIPALAALIAGGSVFVLCKEIRNCHKYMAYTMIFEGLFLMLQWIIGSGLRPFSALIYLLYIVMMLTSPFLYYFASIYFLKKEGVNKKDFWMLEAVAVFAFIFLFIVRAVPQAERAQFMRMLSNASIAETAMRTGTAVLLSLDWAAYIFFLLEQFFVQIFCFVNLGRYRKLLGQYYSSLKGKAPDKLTAIFVLVSLRFAVFLCLSLIPGIESSIAFRIIMCVTFCAFYAAITFYVCSIRYTAEELSALMEKEEKLSRVPAADETISARLESLVNEKFFLNPDIDLFSVSSKIKVNSRYVSDFLKYHFSETFLSWTNRLRIEYSVGLMDDKNLTLADIAEQSGYTSISTFYRNFAKIKGISPSDFRKKHGESCK